MKISRSIIALLMLAVVVASCARVAVPACPPAQHPGVAIEGARGDELSTFPGVSRFLYYQIGIYGLPDSGLLDYLSSGGYALVIFDEPVWRLHHYRGLTVTEAAAQASALLNPAISVARAAVPGVKFQVVEPFKTLLWAYLAAGGVTDYVAGEDYGSPHPGDVRLADLYSIQDAYGVGIQQWVLGADRVMAYEGRVDLVIAGDIHGAWGIVPDYADALRAGLSATCKAWLPLAADSGGYPSP